MSDDRPTKPPQIAEKTRAIADTGEAARQEAADTAALATQRRSDREQVLPHVQAPPSGESG